jgi:hypothetical protein
VIWNNHYYINWFSRYVKLSLKWKFDWFLIKRKWIKNKTDFLWNELLITSSHKLTNQLLSDASADSLSSDPASSIVFVFFYSFSRRSWASAISISWSVYLKYNSICADYFLLTFLTGIFISSNYLTSSFVYLLLSSYFFSSSSGLVSLIISTALPKENIFLSIGFLLWGTVFYSR